MDHFYSIYQLIQDIQLCGFPICIGSFDHESSTHIQMKCFWNLQLFKSEPVLNHIELGNNCLNNVIITGPNAGGKTTLIKSILYNILFYHLFGFSCSQTYSSSQFDYIYSHIHKKDSVNEYSLFQSEIKHFNAILLELDKSQHAFGALDEMFTSTTPEEGSCCAYAMAETLNRKNGLLMLTTHFKKLALLEFDNGQFFNISMGYHNNQFTYMSESGINRIHLAIQLLKSYPKTSLVYQRAYYLLTSNRW
jgi:DNA mismatch repair protein MutS